MTRLACNRATGNGAGNGGRKLIPGSYIAILKTSGDVNGAAADVIKGNGKINYKYEGSLKGIAFDVPPGSAQAQEQVLEKIRSRLDVEYITEDYEVNAVGSAGEVLPVPYWPTRLQHLGC